MFVMPKKVYCFYCCLAYQNNLITFTQQPKTAFFLEGFSNWKKAIERFRVHEAADCHKEAKLKLSSAAAPTVHEQMSIENAKAMALNREMFLKVLSSLMLLMRQGLAIRGHKDDDSDGNLLQLLKLRCEDDSRLSKWLDRRQYLSHDIINEVITIFGKELLRQLLDNIRNQDGLLYLQMKPLISLTVSNSQYQFIG